MSSSKFVEKLHKKTIKNFMDIFVLAELKKRSLSGYDFIDFIHRRFGIMISSGTIYSLLYSLERDGLIKGTSNERKRVYVLTEKGEHTIGVVTKANNEIQELLRNISLLNTNQQSPTPT